MTVLFGLRQKIEEKRFLGVWGGQKWSDDLFQNLMAPKWITSYAFGRHLCEILMVGKGEDGRGRGWPEGACTCTL